MRKRKAYLVLELDADETSNILPPHLRGMLSRPLVEPVQTRTEKPENWFLTEQQKRERRRQERIRKAKAEHERKEK